MKYDCTNTIDFVHEYKRFCDSRECDSCEFQGYCADGIERIDQGMIDTVQAWSDAHPERTNADVFIERYPNAMLSNNVLIPYPCEMDKGYKNDKNCSKIKDCIACKAAYWNAPYEEPAESEEKGYSINNFNYHSNCTNYEKEREAQDDCKGEADTEKACT